MSYVSRVNQLDAGVLDDEIYKVLESKATDITKYCPPGTLDKWQPEINALLKYLIWHFSLRTGTSTFGQQLLNLRFINLTKRKSLLYLALLVLPRYIQEKFSDDRNVITSSESGEKFKSAVEWIGNVASLLEFLNLLIFLNRGTQPRLIERFLGISSQSDTTHRPRNIGYSYMTRELLWHGLMETFALGLPMINYHYVKQLAKRLLFRRKVDRIIRTNPTMDLSTKCPYCEENPVLPTHAGCQHIFCYYCLKAHFTAMHVYVCPECGMELQAKDMKTYVAKAVPAIADDETQ